MWSQVDKIFSTEIIVVNLLWPNSATLLIEKECITSENSQRNNVEENSIAP
jgi:hypothetical protein